MVASMLPLWANCIALLLSLPEDFTRCLSVGDQKAV